MYAIRSYYAHSHATKRGIKADGKSLVLRHEVQKYELILVLALKLLISPQFGHWMCIKPLWDVCSCPCMNVAVSSLTDGVGTSTGSCVTLFFWLISAFIRSCTIMRNWIVHSGSGSSAEKVVITSYSIHYTKLYDF